MSDAAVLALAVGAVLALIGGYALWVHVRLRALEARLDEGTSRPPR